MGKVLSGASSDHLARASMVHVQWHVLGALLAYFLVVRPLARLDASWWLVGRLGALHPAIPPAVLAFLVLVGCTYLVRLRSDRDSRWEHALRHSAVACILLVPAIVGALNQRAEGGILAFVVAMFALPLLVYARPSVVLSWSSVGAVIVIVAAAAWQEGAGVRTTVITNVTVATVFAGVLYVFVDRYRVRNLARERELLALARLRDLVFHAIDHDLKTPMLQVRQVGRALGEGREIAPDEAGRLSRELERASGEAFHVIGNLTAIGRAPGAAAPGGDPICDVESAVDAAVTFVSADAASKRIAIRKRADDAEVPAACSHDAVLAILRNVLANAVKFSVPGSEVHVRLHVDPDVVRIVVEDDGIGIPPQVLASVQDGRPVRGSHGTVGEVGSGLGLVVARSLASTVGGTLEIENRAEGGVRTSLAVPRYRPFGRADRA